MHQVRQVRGDFEQWLQDEAPLLEPGVGETQAWLLAMVITVEQQVEIKCPGSPAGESSTPVPTFHLEQRVEQLPWRQVTA